MRIVKAKNIKNLIIKKGGEKMLQLIKDDFDESPEDILNTINNMLNSKDNQRDNQTEETHEKDEKDGKDEI